MNSAPKGSSVPPQKDLPKRQAQKKNHKKKGPGRQIRVLFVTSEVIPFSKTGGLGEVSGTLPLYLKEAGIDIKIITPRYYAIDKSKFKLKHLPTPLAVPVGFGEKWAGVFQGSIGSGKKKVDVFFLEHDAYFGREGLYNVPNGEPYPDNAERFVFLSRGALQLAKHLNFIPDVIHLNDWQSALAAIYLNTWEAFSAFHKSVTLLTIHNMMHQGLFSKDNLVHTQLGWEYFTHLGMEHNDKVNFLKGGIFHATKINTVSPSYAWEIQTPEGAYGLDGVLRERKSDISGILNGIDCQVWNPEKDKWLPYKFSRTKIQGKAKCKAYLQKKFGLAVKPDVPLIGFISRLDWQKGIDILAEAMPRIMEQKIQFVLLGVGETWANFYFGDLPAKYPGRAGAFIGFSEELAHLIEAGADMFLMPSRFEPCGLNQMYSQRYGTLPIVRAIGGLKDTVINFSESPKPHLEKGTGFAFNDLTANAIYDTVGWAVYTYYNKKKFFDKMVQNAMSRDFSWEKAAAEYTALYREAIIAKNGSL